MSGSARSGVRTAAVLVAIGASALAYESPSLAHGVTAVSRAEIVQCSSAIDVVPAASPASSDRVLFDRVWIAGRDRVASPNTQPVGSGRFVYYAKTGFNVLKGQIGALVDVPRAWRNRVRITWGNVAWAVSIRFPGCRSGPAWTSYAGGFLFHDKRGGCVPLRVAVQGKTTTVYFSAGRRC